MPNDQQVERFIETVRPGFESLKAKAEEARPDVKVGCALGLLVPAIGLALALVLPVPWPFKLGGLVVGLASAIVGIPRLVKFGGKAGALKAPFEEQVLLPFARLLVPDGVLIRDRISNADARRSILFAAGVGGSPYTARIQGTIAGLPATLDEHFWDRSKSSWAFNGWTVRFQLPFAVAGHLRVRSRAWESHVITDGFRVLPDATARVGEQRVVDVGPLEGEPLAGIPPAALLGGALLEWIEVDPLTQVAVAGRELWVVLPSGKDVFPEQVVNLELETLRLGARRFAIADAIAREVVAAGSARR